MTNTIVFLSLCALAVALLTALCKQYDKRQDAERENWQLKNKLDQIEFDVYRQFMNPDGDEFTAGWNSALDAVQDKIQRVRGQK